MSETITTAQLRELVAGWLALGRAVAGPRRIKPDLVMYQAIQSPGELLLQGFVRPANSIKEFVFPRHEKLYGYRFQGKRIELQDAELPTTEQIIIGARPCDAATFPILDRVFNWDFKDALYNRRRELTTVITLACRQHDEHCFCTSVGCGPTDERGSDVMLLELEGGLFEVRCLTEKGTRLFSNGRAGILPANPVTDAARTAAPQGPEDNLNLDAIRHFLEGSYEAPVWQTTTGRCLGCGACAYTCPTCHCFDMVDEGNAAGGARVRNWDACQFALFTLHASGHNPRNVQAQRQRQRIYHKFQIYPDKFGPILCTGCGNCTRNCPVGLGVRPVLEAIRSYALPHPACPDGAPG